MLYRGLKFPHITIFLRVPESDAANTSLNGHCAKTRSAMLVVVCCYKLTRDREKDLWKYWPPEGWFSSDITSLLVTVAPARSVGWGRNEALTLLYLVPWPIAVICSMQTQYSETFFINVIDQKLHWCSR
jgi:hypothetical protein